ncbi:PTS system ascorbate-specific transporter subunits IICB [Listeria grayi]|uniref:PTS system, Lactose/Cellobiose specific IIB subunit n=3 Tax=Listeria grayi TaxID=1641 RepID=D7UWD0_LISGR|nr:PTS sugar transporter subunit IIB [Listeria grayi]EFI84858.1 PTS system, Lactose/Cellobiose specific IIB subunit [Listeria grayi DSM 20601]EUJ28360.1 PTS system mannitol-specific transporter subunit IIB [Listeria grayi FSL F6-1183]MBC1922526.1 PTS sugar transporter subunit IIB [Listeria grayi]STY44335.1 PTS system ascorbate-specific transporter subunits IICB [Listeria grayi]VEI36198.1 PTS system ascorbate-specific transporter subunits IICB [Listeria grayi]
MKFAAVCGSGLGSSFMVEMNINTVLSDLGVDDVEVSHYDMGSASPDLADVFFVAKDLEDSAAHLGEVVVLDSIIDLDELRDKVEKVCKEKGLL